MKAIENGFIDDFIRNFVINIIVHKIDDDRNNLKLDIYINLLKQKNFILKDIKTNNYLAKYNSLVANQVYKPITTTKTKRLSNIFTYSVYTLCD